MSLQPITYTTRTIQHAVLNEVLLLVGLAALLWVKWARGQLDFYIHPRYATLVLVSAIILLLMAGVRLRHVFAAHPTRNPGWTYLLVALPLVFGTLVPVQPLGANTLIARGLEPSNAVHVSNWQPSLASDSSEWDLLQWAVALSFYGPELDDRPVDVIGFVFQDARAGADHFYVARYVITCCAADGVSVGMPVAWPGGETLPLDDWVRVRGTLTTTVVAGVEQATIVATAVEPVAAPPSPYLYP